MSQFKAFVGNLSFGTTDQTLRDEFSSCGQIADLRIITDYETGRSRGFGFITFENQESLDEALKLDGNEFEGRNISVKVAEERKPRQRD